MASSAACDTGANIPTRSRGIRRGSPYPFKERESVSYPLLWYLFSLVDDCWSSVIGSGRRGPGYYSQ